MEYRSGELSKDLIVHPDLPPTLIISARDDRDHFESGQVYAQALEAAGASIRTHFFERGGHGFGLRTGYELLNAWPGLALDWLDAVGALSN